MRMELSQNKNQSVITPAKMQRSMAGFKTAKDSISAANNILYLRTSLNLLSEQILKFLQSNFQILTNDFPQKPLR